MSIDLDKLIERLRRCELIEEDEVEILCSKARNILMLEPNIVPVVPPVTIVGDIHGQFFDLLEIFEISGHPPFTNYLFLGDLVDRGSRCLETILLVLALKVRYPSMITLIRGNHESREVSTTYGTYKECLTRYGHANVWLTLCDVFDWFCVGAIVESIFAVHGGLSPNAETFDAIDKLERNCEIPHTGPLADLTWSDPSEEVDEWGVSPRGSGYLFGKLSTKKFHHTNKTTLLVRAHQLVLEGFHYLHDQTVLTIWSAPNYMYNCGNVASVLELDEKLNRKFKVFTSAPGDEKHSKARLSVPEYFL